MPQWKQTFCYAYIFLFNLRGLFFNCKLPITSSFSQYFQINKSKFQHFLLKLYLSILLGRLFWFFHRASISKLRQSLKIINPINKIGVNISPVFFTSVLKLGQWLNIIKSSNKIHLDIYLFFSRIKCFKITKMTQYYQINQQNSLRCLSIFSRIKCFKITKMAQDYKLN